jgi:hypothetical protein
MLDLDGTNNTSGAWLPDNSEILSSFTVHATADSLSDVTIYWVTGDVFDNKGFPFARGLALLNGDKILLNDTYKQFIGTLTLHHELAHCLGFQHGDGGIVNLSNSQGPRNDHKSGVSLAKSTKGVAQVFEGFRYFSWDISDLGYAGRLYSSGELTLRQLGYGGRKYASSGDDVLYTTDFDMFGGHKTTRKTEYGGKTILENQFYGTPATSG